MKKIKLITSLSSIGALIATAPIAINCSVNSTQTKKELEKTPSEPVIPGQDASKSYEMKLLRLPEEIQVGKTVEAEPVVSINGILNLMADYELFQADSCLNARLEGTYVLKLKPTIEAVNRKNKLVFKVTYRCGDKYYYAYVTYYIDNVVCDGNWMTLNGTQYELADNIDPNVFVSCDHSKGTTLLHGNIPLKDGGYVTIGMTIPGQHYDGWWGSLTTLQLKSFNPSVTKIKDGFLSECSNLKTLDLGNLTAITNIGKYFLAGDSRLTNLIVPNKSAVYFSTNSDHFMSEVPTDAIIECGENLGLYQNIAPWSSRRDQMVGEHEYTWSNVHWRSQYTVNDGDKIAIAIHTQTELKLYDKGVEVKDYELSILEGTDWALGSETNGKTVYIDPNESCVGKTCKLVVGAFEGKWPHRKYITQTTITIDNIVGGNMLVAGNKQFILADNLNPNLLATNSIISSFIQDIPLKDGGYVSIGHNYIHDGKYDWEDVKAIKLRSLDKSVTKLDGYFLSACTYLTCADLTGFTTLTYIGGCFMSSCENIWDIWLPQQDPHVIDYWGDGWCFLYDKSSGEKLWLHAGSYYSEYSWDDPAVWPQQTPWTRYYNLEGEYKKLVGGDWTCH